jgi:hypothetical protein
MLVPMKRSILLTSILSLVAPMAAIVQTAAPAQAAVPAPDPVEAKAALDQLRRFIGEYDNNAKAFRHKWGRRIEWLNRNADTCRAVAEKADAAGHLDFGAARRFVVIFIEFAQTRPATDPKRQADLTRAAILAKDYFAGMFISHLATAEELADASQFSYTAERNAVSHYDWDKAAHRLNDPTIRVRFSEASKAAHATVFITKLGTGRYDSQYNAWFDAHIKTLASDAAKTVLKNEISALALVPKTTARDNRLVSLLTTYDVLKKLE